MQWPRRTFAIMTLVVKDEITESMKTRNKLKKDKTKNR
jgi:hypothetical protein